MVKRNLPFVLLALASALAFAYLPGPWRWPLIFVTAALGAGNWFFGPNRRFTRLSVQAIQARHQEEAFTRAEALARQALAEAHRARWRRPLVQWMAQDLLCSILLQQNKLAEAEQIARALIEHVAKAGLDPGEHHPQPPQRLLAHILLRAGQTDEAETILRKLQEAFYFREHPLQRGAILGDLASLEAERHRPARAADWNSRAIHLLESHGASDRELATLYMNRAGNYSQDGDPGAALADYQKALFLHERAEPESTVTALLLSNMGVAELELGRPREAAKTLRRSVECWQRVATPWDPRYAMTCHILAEALLAAGETEAAVAYAERSLEVKGGPAHDDYPGFLLTLVSLRERLGQRSAALQLLGNALPAVEQHLGPSHADTVRLRARHERLSEAQAA